MERSSSNITIINEPLTLKRSKLAVLESPVSASKSKKRCNDVDRKKKRHGPLHMIKLAMLMLDLNNSQNKKSTRPTGTSLWKKIVCSMRPLYLQNDVGSPPRITSPPPVTVVAVTAVENFEVFTPPMSPTHLSTSSSDTMSQYASAVNLQALDQEDINHDDQDKGFCGEDEMIDVKAELFIAQFYQQMRLQHGDDDY